MGEITLVGATRHCLPEPTSRRWRRIGNEGDGDEVGVAVMQPVPCESYAVHRPILMSGCWGSSSTKRSRMLAAKLSAEKSAW